MVGRKKLEGPGVNFFEIPRRQLQSLCKKYGFPANRTNQKMAEFLTSHLNSDEYLNRDKSLPSPAVKTRFQCREDESATGDSLHTISESQETVAEAAVRSLSEEFMNVDVTPSDSPLKTTKPEGAALGEATQNGSEDIAGGSAFEEAKDFTSSGFRIREYKSKSVKDNTLPSTTESVSMECGREGSSRGSPTGFGDRSSSEEEMDATTTVMETGKSPLESENSQGLETPLPLSVMPYVRPSTPDSTLSRSGLKLFVDLENDGGSPSVENMPSYYGAWGAQIPSRTNTTMQGECTVGGSEAGRQRLETHCDNGLTGTDRAVEEREMTNFLSQASFASTSCKETGAAPFYSCLVTPNRTASVLSVSFPCPESKFSSPTVNAIIPDSAKRSEIVKEWSSADELETCRGVPDALCSEELKAGHGELLQKREVELRVREQSELNIRSTKFTLDLESPPEGIVEKLVKVCEERSPSKVHSASQRKETYNASPSFKSSRFAAELERASKFKTVADFSRHAQAGSSCIIEDSTSEENSCEPSFNSGTMSIATDQELKILEEPVIASVSTDWTSSLKSKENPAEKPAALSLLDIDFTKIMVQNVVEVPQPNTVSEIDCPTLRERITAERSTPLSPLDSNRGAIDAVVDTVQNATTPTKPISILDSLSESEERNRLSSYNKENEWSRRLEQHKTPLTGRSKEKALRTAEKKASTLREQLLRKRRGLIEGVIDYENPLVQVHELSPIKKVATNRML